MCQRRLRTARPGGARPRGGGGGRPGVRAVHHQAGGGGPGVRHPVPAGGLPPLPDAAPPPDHAHGRAAAPARGVRRRRSGDGGTVPGARPHVGGRARGRARRVPAVPLPRRRPAGGPGHGAGRTDPARPFRTAGGGAGGGRGAVGARAPAPVRRLRRYRPQTGDPPLPGARGAGARHRTPHDRLGGPGVGAGLQRPAHLVRDFTAAVGLTPAAYAARCGGGATSRHGGHEGEPAAGRQVPHS